MATTMRPGPQSRTLAERFLGKYRVAADGCWIWTAATSKSGYGKIYSEHAAGARGSLISAHVASYLVHRGPIPDGAEIDHLCRVKLCVNPDHLEAVTHAENMARSHRAGGAHQLARQVAALTEEIAVLRARLAQVDPRAAGQRYWAMPDPPVDVTQLLGRSGRRYELLDGLWYPLGAKLFGASGIQFGELVAFAGPLSEWTTA